LVANVDANSYFSDKDFGEKSPTKDDSRAKIVPGKIALISRIFGLVIRFRQAEAVG
jgi:hypothetical protein